MDANDNGRRDVELEALASRWAASRNARVASEPRDPKARVVPCVHPKYGPARFGLVAEVVPGKSITLVGTIPAGQRYETDPATGRSFASTQPRAVRRAFKVGDVAETHSYNLVYTGRIRSITAKTVTIVEDDGSGRGKVYRQNLYAFAERNWDFDEAAAAKRNSEWMD